MQQAVSLMLTGIWMLVLINESARMTALPETKSPAYIDGKIEPPPSDSDSENLIQPQP